MNVTEAGWLQSKHTVCSRKASADRAQAAAHESRRVAGWSYAWLPPAPVASRGAAAERDHEADDGLRGPRRTAAADMTETAPVVTPPLCPAAV